MTVAGRIVTGFGLLMVLLLGVLTYDLAQVRRLAAVNRDLSEINFRATMTTLEMSRLLNQLDEFTSKFVVTRDPAYAARLGELRAAFESHMEELRSLDLSENERAATERFLQLWAEYSEAAAFQPMLVGGPDPEIAEELRDLFEQRLNLLVEQAARVMETTRTAVSRHVEQSLAASQRARRISWIGVALALILSLPILWLTIRSIREPLRRLTEGTQAVADGEFVYRLDASRTDEFSELALSFNRMVRRLGELDRMKRDFVSHVSHELKTPLVAMQETNSLLLEGIPGSLNEKQKRLLHLNQQSGRRLSAMISRLLDLARLEAGAVGYDFHSHDLVGLVRKVVTEFEARDHGPAPRIEVEVADEPIVVRCDEDRLFQVVENLVDNAAKYSPAEGTVSLRVGSSLATGDSGLQPLERVALVEVRDSGPGVPDDFKERIFEKFQQVNPGPRGDGGGVGLGLAICREIVEAHGGKVWVSDNPGAGSIFSFHLPLAVGFRSRSDDALAT
ncbi:MAG: ATP-binding protein [Thermoanaerobaculia bacterium]